MTSKEIQPFIIPKSYVIDRERERETERETERDREKAIPKKEEV